MSEITIKRTDKEPKWVIIENTFANKSVRKCHHRDKMFIANIIYEVGQGLIDVNTDDIYNCAFNNRQFEDEESAKKYLSKYFKDERLAIESMLNTINNFEEENPEMMI